MDTEKLRAKVQQLSESVWDSQYELDAHPDYCTTAESKLLETVEQLAALSLTILDELDRLKRLVG